MRISGKISRPLSALLSAAIILSTTLAGCTDGRASEPISESRLMLDTFCTITLYGTQDASILRDALDLCEEYETMLSITVEGSDIWRINHANGAAVVVSPETAEIIRAGLEYAKLSGGKFDITIGRLSTLWDFTGKAGVPKADDIEHAKSTVDYRNVSVDGDTVRISNPETWIDLGGIAKGYIADRAAEFLRGRGVAGAVIDLGGNIVVVGQKPDSSVWRVGVTNPFGERSDLVGVIDTAEASVVSSGIYERKFESEGVLYHHILDPRTGMPVVSDVVGATVVSAGSMDGDAVSTTILLLGSEHASSVLDKCPGFIGALIIRDDGEIVQYGTVDFHQ